MEDMKASICETLPSLAPEALQATLEHFVSIGVESESDLRLIEESDLKQFLKPIQSRKLIMSWKTRAMQDANRTRDKQRECFKYKPSSPSNLQVVEVCKDYVFVKWQAPMSDGNSPITRYVVEKADARTPNFTTACHTDCDTLEVKVSQLNVDKQYLIRVFAENVIGQSEPITLQEPVRLPLDKPSSPSNLQVVEVCKDYVFVKWQAPMSDGNSPITRYVVEKADARTPNFTTACHTDCDTLEVKVSQLNKGKHYFLRVFAENAIGQSEPVSLQEPVRLPLGMGNASHDDSPDFTT
ncbi:Twitchin [Lamellibrachia satsuma]|nr:Twitchin [Lamellibrachia satsuma]